MPHTKRVLATTLVMALVLATVVQLMVRVLHLDLAPTSVALMVAMGKVVNNTPRATVDDRKAMAPTVRVMVVAISPVPVTVMATKRALALATQNMLLAMVITRKLPKDMFFLVIKPCKFLHHAYDCIWFLLLAWPGIAVLMHRKTRKNE